MTTHDVPPHPTMTPGPIVHGPRIVVEAVRAALGRVRDPELDEPITDLGFVETIDVGAAGVVLVELRLPTYFCAPNFAYLMVADAHAELRSLSTVKTATVRLNDHFASEEINAGVEGGEGFTGTFPGLADDELEELRTTFRRKAHVAAQERLASRLQRRGGSLAELAGARLADLDDPADRVDLDRLRSRRNELGLPSGPDAHLLLDDGGQPLDVDELPVRLRFARTTRVSIEGNAGLCRGLLATRYGLPHS